MITNNLMPTSPLAAMTQASSRLNDAVSSLQSQLSSGVRSDTYAGLGASRTTALNLQPQITAISGLQSNITTSQSMLTTTQTAMSQISTIVTSLQSTLTGLVGSRDAATVAAASTQAQNALTDLGSLLNTTSGGLYVFGGTFATDPPVSDPAALTTGSFFQSIGASMSNLASAGAGATQAAALAAVSNPSSGLFSNGIDTDAASASALNRKVGVGDQDTMAVGIVATQGSSSSAASTGSPIRDLMALLAEVGNIGQASASSGAMSDLLASMTSQASAIGDQLTSMTSQLGLQQDALTSKSDILQEVSGSLTLQLGAAKDSDAATLSTQLSETQSQLQASYSVIADMKGMSLASYL